MAKSPQEYIDELYRQGQNTANSLHSQRTQADEEFIKQVNEAIDRATTSSTKPYQSQIEQLPGQYQKLYDTNAVQELVNRRQVQETMANMGLTDSGLNRTQQTAIALQRGNADSAARLSQQQKTQELQDKIAQLIEAGSAQKQQQEAAIRNNTENWRNEMLNNLYNNAVQQGTSRYNAEQEAEAAKAAAEVKAQQQQFDNANTAVSAFVKLIGAGYSDSEALAYMRKYGLLEGGTNSNSPASGGSSINTSINDAVNSAIAGAQAGLNATGNHISSEAPMSKEAFQRAQRLGRSDLQKYRNYDEYLASNTASTGTLSPKTETEVVQFISKYTPFELSNPNPDPQKYGNSNNDYLKGKLAEEYNAGNLSAEAFEVLRKHYGM